MFISRYFRLLRYALLSFPRLFLVRPSSKGRPKDAAQCIAATRLVSGTGTTTSTCISQKQARRPAMYSFSIHDTSAHQRDRQCVVESHVP